MSVTFTSAVCVTPVFLIISGINRAETAADVTAQGLLILKFAMMALPLLAILVGYVVYLKKYRIDAAYYDHIVEELRRRGDIR